MEYKDIWALTWDGGLWGGCEVFNVPTYAADFETTADPDDCRVWAWAASEVGDAENVSFGNDIESFVSWCRAVEGSRVYFHNLKFDGKFVLHHLLSNGWTWVAGKDDARHKTFTTLISDMGQFYSIKLYFTPVAAVELLDSLKVIPLPVASIPKAFGLSIEKLDIDYLEAREPGHVLTDKERAYIANDVKIVALALQEMYERDMKRITAGSNAFHHYVKSIGGKKRFRDWYPEPDYDLDLRKGGCYKGGFVMANPEFAGKIVGPGLSFDVNSLYPSVMASVHGEVLPYGEPEAYEGSYVEDPEMPLYIQFLEADFTVKEGHIPCMQLKGNRLFGETEYIRDSGGLQPLCLTSVDLEMLFEQYDVHDVRYVRGYKFKGSTLLFKDYVREWTEVKQRATLEGNAGMRTIAKLQLNSLYGKMATNPVKQSRMPYLDEGVVKYALLDEERKEAVYIPVGAFITAYARAFTVRAAQANYDRWLYSDTDSNYFLGSEMPDGLEVDDVELGMWKLEHRFDRFKALRAKSYCFEEGGELVVHCAGMPSRCHSGVTMENFAFGTRFAGKLRPKDVKGGTILVEDVFTIHE